MAKTYDIYKDSGVAWIGEIPSRWKVGFVGRYFDEIKNPNTNQEETNTLQFKMGDIISKKDGDSKNIILKLLRLTILLNQVQS